MGISSNLSFVLAGVLCMTVCSSTKIQPALEQAEPVVHNDKLLAAALGDQGIDGEANSEPYESPNLYQDPRMGKWYVNETVICIVLEMGMRFHFNYEKYVDEDKVDTEMGHVAVEIPTNAPADGDCSASTHHIRILPFDGWEYMIHVEDRDEHYSATQVTIKYVLDETHFPGTVDPGVERTATLLGSYEDEDGYFFKTEKLTGFACRQNVQLDGFEEVEDLELERIESSNFRLECFRDDTGIEFEDESPTICKADEIDMIPPIAIGIVVACIMLAVIIVYALMRMRRNPVYEATTAEDGVESEDGDKDKSESDETGDDNNDPSEDTAVKGADNNIV